jgi:hypothetical protein
MFAFIKALVSLTGQLKRIADALCSLERLYRLELGSRNPAIIELDPKLTNEKTEVLYDSLVPDDSDDHFSSLNTE